MAQLGGALRTTWAPAGHDHVASKQLLLDEHHQIRAVEIVNAVWQADEALNVGQPHVKMPGSVNWLALSFTACWRMM